MLRKRPGNLFSLLVLLVGMVAVGLTHAAPASSQDDADAKIEQAMSAAPPSVSKDATIYDLNVDDSGNFIVLREGTNDWSCFPDAPGTPSADPMCLDQTWMGWLAALIAQKDPDTKVPGLAYMLQGGSDASNTDPYATEPAEGDEWVSSPPHDMLLLPGELDQSVFSTDHAAGGPFIMWAGTPYEHIMMPVSDDMPMQ
jgi:hypothetical protein